MLKTIRANNKWLLLSLIYLIVISFLQWKLQLSPLTTIVSILVLLTVIWFLLNNFPNALTGKKSLSPNFDIPSNSSAAERFDTKNSVRNIGLKLQGLGQLNLAFEKFKQCAQNHNTANLMYNLSIDFQIKGDPENAKRVLEHIASFEPNFKDVKQRLRSFGIEDISKPELIGDDENLEFEIDVDIAAGIDFDLELTEDLNANRELQLPDIVIDEALEPTYSKTIILPPSASPTMEREIDALGLDNNSEVESRLVKQKYSENVLRDYPTLYGSRFKPIKLLGEGTTGAVFKGTDIIADRTVAIKVLSLDTEIESDQLDEYKFRFYREIETAGNLNHPNIVKVYDNCETDGFAYIVMEYVNGINLRNYARADKLLHPKTILKLVAQCADALSYAHKRHVIHRDIKPANILYNSADDYVKLTDFGIAKIPDSTRTRAGSILGTPLYMSPEQLAGEKLDIRSDLYSLGVTLYHLLTGSPPFRPKTMAELLRSITNDRHKDIAEINPNTPACIAWTVNKALEKEPDKRFQSAASMANKLRECEMMLD